MAKRAIILDSDAFDHCHAYIIKLLRNKPKQTRALVLANQMRSLAAN